MPNRSDTHGQWPRFELSVFSAPTGIPHGWDAELLRKGVPKALFGRYVAAEQLTLLEIPGHGPLIRFGTTMLINSLCLDPMSGAVLETIYNAGDDISQRASMLYLPGFVNSTLDQFTACVHAVIDRFPFDHGQSARMQSGQSDNESQFDKLFPAWERAGTDMTEMFQRIDPVAVANDDTFWRTFLDDVQMGDFSSKKALGESAQ